MRSIIIIRRIRIIRLMRASCDDMPLTYVHEEIKGRRQSLARI